MWTASRTRASLPTSFIGPAALAGALLLSPALLPPAWALSEIQREELPAPESQAAPTRPSSPADALPFPGGEAPSEPAEGAPAQTLPDAEEPAAAEPGASEEGEEAQPGEPTAPAVVDDGPLPPVSYDLGALPEPVRRMHGLLIEASKSGDIERLRTLISTGEDGTQLSLGGIEGDVIEFLRASSGDGDGFELLAILEEVLSAGYAHVNAGKPDELYVWPYFFAVPLDRLDNRQKVELFKIVTSGDYEEMKTFGAYVFYRAGITPDGRWAFFLAGD